MFVSFRQFWNAVELSHHHQSLRVAISIIRTGLAAKKKRGHRVFLSGCDGRASTFALTWVVSILIEAMGDKRRRD
jgi:hypothetical protein